MTLSTDQTLNYQLYFFLQTYRRKKDEYIAEPLDLKDDNSFIHFSQDKDKRLFRFDIANRPLAEFPQHCSTCWEKIRERYKNCRVVQNHATGQKTSLDARADDLLMGVALVILAENLTDLPPITLPLLNHQGQQLGEMQFVCKQSSPLFTVSANSTADETDAVQFRAFQPSYTQPIPERDKVLHWQLELTSARELHLVAIRCEENDDHPIFVVYGLSSPPVSMATLTEWLLYGGSDKRYTAVMHLMSGLLMGQWQYSHIDAAASRLLDNLDNENAAYRSHTDAVLRCTDTETLQVKLQAMKTLDAEAKHILGRIQGAIMTLQINQANLPNRMDTVQRVAQTHGWQIDWQWQQDSFSKLQSGAFPNQRILPALEPALLEDYTYNIEELKNRQVYIQSALKHLEGSGTRWQVAIEEQQMELSERFGKIGHAIIFLVALAEMGHAFSRSGEHGNGKEVSECVLSQLPHHVWENGFFEGLHCLDSSSVIHTVTQLLSSPTVYLVLVAWILWPLGKDLWKVMKRKWKCRKWKKQVRKS